MTRPPNAFSLSLPERLEAAVRRVEGLEKHSPGQVDFDPVDSAAREFYVSYNEVKRAVEAARRKRAA